MTTVALPHGGSNLASYDSNGGATDGTGACDATYSAGSIFVPYVGPYPSSPTWAAAADFWFHGYIQSFLPLNPVASEQTVWQAFAGATEVARLTATGFTSTTFKAYTLQSGVLTLVGTTSAIPNYPTSLIIDAHVKAGASGVFELFGGNAATGGGTTLISVTGLNHTGFAGVTQVKLGAMGASPGAGWSWSETINDAESHVGDRLYQFRLDSDGQTGFTGGVTQINQLPTSAGRFIYAASAGLISTFYDAGLDLSAYNIAGLIGAMQANCGASGPQNGQMVITASGVDHASGSGTGQASLSTGLAAFTVPWVENPQTVAPWTASEAAAARAGPKSIA